MRQHIHDTRPWLRQHDPPGLVAALTKKRLLTYVNPCGLFSEDVDARTGSQWGNFPQAYSHVGLVNAAYRIARRLDLPAFV